MNMEKWLIHIDIEGFSLLWDKENRVLISLCELMKAIYRIGNKCYPNSPDRIFAHQLGDGFIIKSEFHEKNLERALTIAIALMQHVASTGRFAKAVIAEGDLSDQKGCYPDEVTNKLGDDLRVSLGMGLMTIFPVMGSALIRAVKIGRDSPRGPLLIIEAQKKNRIPKNFSIQFLKGRKYNLLSIDWVHMDSDLLRHVKGSANLNSPPIARIEQLLTKYFIEYNVPKDWKQNVHKLLNVQ
jgi:hypothetical protein